MLIRGLIALLLLAAVVFSAREIGSWSRPSQTSPISPRQRAIRFYAILLLITVLCMGLGGTFLPVPQAQGQQHNPAVQKAVLNYLGYWLATGVLFIPIIPLSILDARETKLRLESDLAQLKVARDQLRELRDAVLQDDDEEV